MTDRRGLKREKILLIYALDTPFIRNDLKILCKFFNVKCLDLSPYEGSLKRKMMYAPKILIEMIRGILWSDLTFTWFADIHAFFAVLLSKIFNRKSMVVVGGYEVVRAPEIKYGGQLSLLKTIMVKFILKNADKVLAVSGKSRNEILKICNRNVELVYNCVDCGKFKPKGKKKNIVITVGRINKITVKRKGIETFVKAAKYLQNIPFVVIGLSDNSIENLKRMSSGNVTFIGFLSLEELIKYYQQAKVYCQLSFYESFGVAVAEAMACGCIPVVTDRGALPEVVGDCGFYVHYGNEKEAAEAIKKALEAPINLTERIRERVVSLFSIERREVGLKRAITEVLERYETY